MSKIILIETEPGKCRWLCESCGKQIDNVSETIFSRPLIESCPHCGIDFDSYELCERRLKTLEETDKRIKELWEKYT